MVAAMSHRGPDSRGTEVRVAGNCTIGFAHTRLAILDLTPEGHQPMASSDGSVWLTFNGEIYNYVQLQKELGALAVRFRSTGDTEVILRSYETWGEDSFDRLRGMFACGVWDDRDRRLILSRDPHGIKPLYYYRSADTFAFASEVRTLLASGLVPRRLSRQGLHSFLASGSVSGASTLVDGVLSLEPGSRLSVSGDRGSIHIKETQPARGLLDEAAATPAPESREEAVAELERILRESVRLHLASDVPLGVFLSGGLDSCAIVALMSEVASRTPKTFSVVFNEREFSEAPQARWIAERYGTDHHELLLTGEQLVSMLPDSLQAMDQPTMDGVNTYVISEAVKKAGITVALSGLGGDELFAGYSTFRRAVQLQKLRAVPRPLRSAAAAIGRVTLAKSVANRKMWHLLSSDMSAATVYAISRELFCPDDIQCLTGTSVLEQTHTNGAAKSRVNGCDPVNAVSGFEMQGYMRNTLLRDSDFMSMAHALEIRVPFVDTEVVRYVLSLPGSWKIDDRRPKPLLIDALGGRIPKEIWSRPKMGFGLPFAEWMQSSLKLHVESVFESKGLESVGISVGYGRSIWDHFQHNPAGVRWSRPWALFTLHQWCSFNRVEL